MKRQRVEISEQDGKCQAWPVTPGGAGPWPAVILYMDAFGIRPSMLQVANHIAAQGYVVLLPDLFYRFGPYGPLDPKEVMKGDFRATVGPMMASTDNLRAAKDSAAFLSYLSNLRDASAQKIGTVGFCMGGWMALAVAGYYPEQIQAAASFHGGNLVTDQPTSPHLVIPTMKAEIYVAGADQDHIYPPEIAKRFEEELTKADVRHKCEIYVGKKHGWMKTDMPVYDAGAAERGWKELFALYARNFKLI